MEWWLVAGAVAGFVQVLVPLRMIVRAQARVSGLLENMEGHVRELDEIVGHFREHGNRIGSLEDWRVEQAAGLRLLDESVARLRAQVESLDASWSMSRTVMQMQELLLMEVKSRQNELGAELKELESRLDERLKVVEGRVREQYGLSSRMMALEAWLAQRAAKSDGGTQSGGGDQ